MEKTRVLFLAEAVHPRRAGWMLTLARALDPERFQPLLAWHPRFNDSLGPLEFPFFPMPGMEPRDYFDRLASLKPIYDLDTLERSVAWELEIYREAAPWVVVSDARPSVTTSTAAARLPHVKVVSAHWSPYAGGPFHISELPIARWIGQALTRALFRVVWPVMTRSHVRALNAVSRRFGGPSVADPRAVYAGGDWTVYTDVPEITPTKDLPPTHRYIGPAVWSAEAPAPPLPADDGRPLVYVDLSPAPAPETLSKVLAALRAASVRAVVATGGVRVPALPGLSFVEVLPAPSRVPGVAAVVCAGGVGTAVPALAAGLPLLGIAGNIDQFLYMNHVESAGLGLMLRAGAAVSDITAALRRILEEPVFRRNAQAMAKTFQARDMRRELGAVIDEVLAAGSGAAKPVPPRPEAEPGPHRPAVDESAARRLVEAALWAPSAGNSQPLRYHWNGEEIAVHVAPFRNNRFMDLANSDLWMALGAALVNMRAAAAALNAGTHVELFPETAREGLLAKVRLSDAPAPEAALAGAIFERCTNRRPYRPEPLPPERLASLGAWADLPGVRLDWRGERPQVDALADSLSFFERILFLNGNIGRCVLQWVRPHTADGFDPACLELDKFERFFFRLSRVESVRLALRRIIARKASLSSARRLRQSGAFGFISVDGLDPVGMVRGGMALQRIWLAAHGQGLAMHPMVGMVLLNFRLRFGGGAGLSAVERRWAAEGLERLQAEVPAFAERIPVAIFRIGFADQPPSQRAWRLPMADVFSVERRP